jgi:quercetin dioxygenase-like cupin family protein
MDIHHAADRATRKAKAEWFTGTVWQDPIVETPEPARARAVSVTFEPGARTAWHTHPLGQTLHVVSGVGRVQAKGGPVQVIRPGDTVWIPPGEKHWHGAAPDHGMVHIAIHEALDGSHVTWMEHVTDAEYAVEPES